ncbi:MAG: YbaN family protein [Clostridia bacterium]
MIKKSLLIVSGMVALGLGILGIFLPVLPTTPFLLLAGYCFLRSSKKLHCWLVNHRVFGSYIYHYMTYKAVKKRAKIMAVIFLWTTLAISFFLVDIIYVRIFLVLVGIAVTTHLALLKTYREDMRDKRD